MSVTVDNSDSRCRWKCQTCSSQSSSERQAYDIIQQDNLTRLEAPFGTQDTPHMSVKIIGSKPVVVIENMPEQDEMLNDHSPKGGRTQPYVINNVSEKPNNIDPRHYGGFKEGYQSAQQDGFSSHIHGKATSYISQRPDSKDLSPYLKQADIRKNRIRNEMSTVFQPESWTNEMHPGIATDTEYKKNFDSGRYDDVDYLTTDRRNGYSNMNRPNTDDDRIELRKYDMGLIPTDPITMTSEDETKLIRIVGKELSGCPHQKLKDVYLDVAAYDKQLSGWSTFEEFTKVMEKHGCFMTESTLRLVASMFVSPFQEKKVNYEKMISFIGTAVKRSQYIDQTIGRSASIHSVLAIYSGFARSVSHTNSDSDTHVTLCLVVYTDCATNVILAGDTRAPRNTQ
ncbi:hypothetical protein ScPMuIL_000337 [Solemya velum]